MTQINNFYKKDFSTCNHKVGKKKNMTHTKASYNIANAAIIRTMFEIQSKFHHLLYAI